MSDYKHDGKLSKDGTKRVTLRERFKDVDIEDCEGGAILEPDEALSLLAWLYERKDELEQLAKEQAK